MGSVLSLIVQNVLYYLPGSFRSKAYKQIESNKNQNSECRSANEKILKPYQSKIDNLKQDQIVYVRVT
jgi:hypothetical protein